MDDFDFIERMKKKAKTATNPLKAIKAFCCDCIGSILPGKVCTNEPCPLFDFREGKNPRRKKIQLSAEKRASSIAILEKARLSKRQNRSPVFADKNKLIPKHTPDNLLKNQGDKVN